MCCPPVASQDTAPALPLHFGGFVRFPLPSGERVGVRGGGTSTRVGVAAAPPERAVGLTRPCRRGGGARGAGRSTGGSRRRADRGSWRRSWCRPGHRRARSTHLTARPPPPPGRPPPPPPQAVWR